MLKKNIKYALMIISILGIIIGCGSQKTLSSPSWFDTAANQKGIITIYNIPITEYQLDSICIVDNLSKNIEEWNKSYYVDYESNDVVYKYTYIKNNNGVTETYILSKFRDSLGIHKHIKQ